MIPARIGSTRLKMKNLALLEGKPVIAHSIEAARKSGVFDRIVLNSDHPVFESIARRYGVEFYLRPQELGSSNTQSDDVVLDFIKKYPCEIVVWVNPISPLQPPEEIRAVIEFFENERLDSLITVKDEQVHCVYENHPVNFVAEEKFARTQDLLPVQSMVYSIMMWRSEPFREAMAHQGYALLNGRVGYFPVSKRSSVIIKTAEDLFIAETILKTGHLSEGDVRYDEIAP